MAEPSIRRAALAAALAASLAACALDPKYERPELPVPPTYADAASAPAEAASASGMPRVAAELGWRDFFADPALQRLIEIALANNRNARIAAINVAAARAQYQVQRADLFPTIDATAQESVARIPGAVIASQIPAAAGAAVASGATITRSFSAGVGFTAYELDLFGRLRSLSRTALEQYFGYAETQRSTVITLVSEVANAYLTVLADRELLRVTQDTLKSQQASYDLTRRSLEGGVGTALALRQAETAVDTARANLALYTRQLAQDRNALVLLLGASIPADLPSDVGIDAERLVEDLPAGVPSELMTRRPDVLAAEHNLLAANASIGAARAAFFPRISLTGNYGSESVQLSKLFDSGSRSWSFSPSISIPIFAGGANVANLELARQQKNLYVATYEQTIQTAFREVSDALVARSTLGEQLQAQIDLENASREAYRLADMRFRGGVDTYLTVLDAQRTLYSAQQGLVTVKLSRLQNLVTLYKALGGGWSETSGAGAGANASLPQRME